MSLSARGFCLSRGAEGLWSHTCADTMYPWTPGADVVKFLLTVTFPRYAAGASSSCRPYSTDTVLGESCSCYSRCAVGRSGVTLGMRF